MVKAVSTPTEKGSRAIVKCVFGSKYYSFTAVPIALALFLGLCGLAAGEYMWLPIAAVILLTVGLLVVLSFRQVIKNLYGEASKKGDVTEFLFDWQGFVANGKRVSYDEVEWVRRTATHLVFRMKTGGCFAVADSDFREGEAKDVMIMWRGHEPRDPE